MDDVDDVLEVVPVPVFVGAAVDERVTVVLEGSALVLSVDVGGVEEGVCCSVDVGSSDVVVGGVSDVVVGGSSLDVVVGGASVEVGSCVVDSVVGGAGSDEVVTGGVDVSAVEVGCSVADVGVGVGVPDSVGSILVLLEDMVKRRSKVSRRRGGLYMVTLAPASDGEV